MNDHSHNLIEIDDLHFAYGSNQVLKGIRLAVPRGKVVGILGVSGAGKSTILKLIGASAGPTAARCASTAAWCTNWTTRASTKCAARWA